MTDYKIPLEDQWGVSPDEDEHSGYANAGTGEDNVPATASVTESWSTPSNITAVSSSTAGMASVGGSYIFPYIRASNFGFNVPAAATMLGVEVEIVWGGSSSDYTLDELKLAWDASATSLSTTDKGTGQSLDKNSGDSDTYGGATDLWGETSSTLTPTDVNSSDFGVVLKPAKTDTGDSDLRIDVFRLIVYYSVTEDGEARVSQSEALVLATNISDPRVTQTYAEAIVSVASSGGVPAGRSKLMVIAG